MRCIAILNTQNYDDDNNHNNKYEQETGYIPYAYAYALHIVAYKVL